MTDSISGPSIRKLCLPAEDLSCTLSVPANNCRPAPPLPAGGLWKGLLHMLSQTTEWQPASLCSIEGTDNSFGGSVEANAGGGVGGADFGAAGNSAGAAGDGGDTVGNIGAAGGALGMTGADPAQTTLADLAMANALMSAGLAGFVGPTGLTGAFAALNTTLSAMYGTSPQTALAHIAHDINLSMATSMSAGFAPNL